MKDRKPFKLKGLLGAWNIALATFSFLAFVRTLPEHLVVLMQPNGFHHSVCSRDGLTYAFAFWAWLGTLSKVLELGDTVFIILRKQPLIFLHWYHHSSVLFYTFYTYDAHDPVHRWFMTMNSLVHAIMYTYYALKCFGIHLPRSLVILITTLQIAQMIVGVTVNWHSLVSKSNGLKCEREDQNIKLALTMYATYFLLFADFFYKTYVKKVKRS
jgi:elongation of very long chain fatty acids protein 6